MKIVMLIILIFLSTAIVNVNANEKTFDVELRKTNITVAIQAMAEKVGASFVLNEEINKKVSVSFSGKTFEEAMEILGKVAGFNWEYKNNIIYISTKEDMVQAIRIRLKYLEPEEMKKELSIIVPEEKIAINLDDSTISVMGTTAEIKKIEEIIQNADKPIEQVHLTVQMIEMSNNDKLDMGFQHKWLDYNNKTTKFPLEISTTLKGEEVLSRGKLIASPSLTTLNGREAKVLMGWKEPILETSRSGDNLNNTTVRYEDVGYKVVCIPRVNKTDEGYFITMKLNPSVSAITGWVTNSDTKAPQISNREAMTNVTVRSGETIIIGGLVKDEDFKHLYQIPGISKIPIIGELFKMRSTTKDKSTIYICVTPTVVDQNNMPILPEHVTKEVKSRLEVK